MKKLIVIFGLLAAIPLFSGCAAARTPVLGSWYTNASAPVTATSMKADGKMMKGTSSATSILGLIGTGDASIDAAMRDGGITQVHHVDYQTTQVLGIYAKTTTIVYGK